RADRAASGRAGAAAGHLLDAHHYGYGIRAVAGGRLAVCDLFLRATAGARGLWKHRGRSRRDADSAVDWVADGELAGRPDDHAHGVSAHPATGAERNRSRLGPVHCSKSAAIAVLARAVSNGPGLWPGSHDFS